MSETSLNSLTRDVRVLLTRGTDALQRDNFDYAIAMFCQVLTKEPGLFECRKALRVAQLKKAGAAKGFFKKMLSSAGSSGHMAKAQIALHSNPVEALNAAEQILNSDPMSSAAHRIIVEAATRLDMPRTAAMSLDILLRNSPGDKDLAIQYATMLAGMGESAKAEAVIAEACRQNPGDNELAQAQKNVAATKTLDEGGYDSLADGTGSYRDILKDKEEAVALEQQNRQVKTEDMAQRLIREYESRLSNEPRNIKLLRDLAELYTQKNQFDRALEYYRRIKDTDLAQDAGLDKAITETTLRKFDYQIASLDPGAADYNDTRAALEQEKVAFELAEGRKLVDRFPTDLQLRFDLGELYLRHGRVGEAIQELQKAQNNPHRRIAALNLLAQCFAQRKMYDLAERTLQTALKEKAVFDDEKKELIYNLGCVLESMGKKEAAVDQFKLIYEVDISFKDVAAKVDAFYAGN